MKQVKNGTKNPIGVIRVSICMDWFYLLTVERCHKIGAYWQFKYTVIPNPSKLFRCKNWSLITVAQLTSRDMIPALRALLPRTKENSLTCASPAETIHLIYWLVFGRIRERTSTAKTNFKNIFLCCCGFVLF